MAVHLTVSAPAQGPRDHERDHQGNIELVVDGFVEDLTSTRSVEEAMLMVRSLSGFLLSSPVVRSNATYPLVPSESPLYIYLSTDDGNRLLRSHMLPSDYSEKIRSFEWTEVDDLYGAKWATWMNFFSGILRPALTATHDKNAVRRASQWYFDSECGSNELLQFIQAPVCLEILLGDKTTSDVLDISELFSNRCAYLLATDHADTLWLGRGGVP